MDKASNERIQLSNILDYERDIKPFPLVEIVSGTGSGKTTLIKQLASKYKILIITPRKSKVEEDVESEDNLYFDSKIRVPKGLIATNEMIPEIVDARSFCKFFNAYDQLESLKESVVCTYAHIEAYSKYVYGFDKEPTHIWRIFDLVVIDEFHSLFLDSTYQSASFYVHMLIRQLYKKITKPDEGEIIRCQNLILMTATPTAYARLHIRGCTTYDLRRKCTNLEPMIVRFIEGDEKEILRTISTALMNHEKVLYFVNQVRTILRLYDKIVKALPMQEDKIGFSFTKKSVRDDIQSDKPKQYDKMLAIEAAIKEKKFPNDIYVVLTTARYQEGVNLEDSTVTNIIVESHNESSVIQMVGRIRQNVNNLYIVVNPQQNIIDYQEKYFSLTVDNDCIEKYNFRLQSYQGDERKKYIEFINNNHEFVKYNIFTDKFEIYLAKKYAFAYFQEQDRKWYSCNGKYQDIVKEWFGNDTHVMPFMSNEQLLKDLIQAFWDRNGYQTDYEYDYKSKVPGEKTKFQLLEEEITKITNKKKYTNKALKWIGITVKICGKGKSKRIFKRIEN